jgi:hypothetical protein
MDGNLMAIYCNSNTNETRTLVTGPVYLRRVVINDTGTAGSFINIYDNTAGSGTLVARIDPTTDSVRTYEIDLANGLTYVTTGGPGNFTVIYG